MGPNINDTIRRARPSLRKILPVVFWQTVVFSILNIMLGLGVFLWKPTIFPLVAPTPAILTVWAYSFLIVGIALGVGLFTKHWEKLRFLMCIGFLMKVLWSIALMFRIHDGGTFLIAALFIGIAALQSVVIIYYLPPNEPSDGTNI